MTVTRGEIWTAELDPTQGSEQAGRRLVLVLQNDAMIRVALVTLRCNRLQGFDEPRRGIVRR